MGGIVDRQLPAHGLLFRLMIAAAVQQCAGAVGAVEEEVVPDQVRLLRGGEGESEHGAAPAVGLPGELQLLPLAGKVVVEHQQAADEALRERGPEGQGHGLSALRRAEGEFALAVARVKDRQIIHTKGFLS